MIEEWKQLTKEGKIFVSITIGIITIASILTTHFVLVPNIHKPLEEMLGIIVPTFFIAGVTIVICLIIVRKSLGEKPPTKKEVKE